MGDAGSTLLGFLVVWLTIGVSQGAEEMENCFEFRVSSFRGRGGGGARERGWRGVPEDEGLGATSSRYCSQILIGP